MIAAIRRRPLLQLSLWCSAPSIRPRSRIKPFSSRYVSILSMFSLLAARIQERVSACQVLVREDVVDHRGQVLTVWIQALPAASH